MIGHRRVGLVREAVGTQGVSLCRKQDFLDLLEGVPMGEVTLSSSVPAVDPMAAASSPRARQSRSLPQPILIPGIS